MRRPAVLVYFTLLLTLCLWILPDYGIGWDEHGQHEKGQIAFDYTVKMLGIDYERLSLEKEFETYDQSFYNSLFPLVGVTLIEALGFEQVNDDIRPATLVFRYLLLFVSFVGFYTLFRLLEVRFRDYRWGLLGLTLFLLSPRVSFHTFFNIKDSVLVAGFSIAMATCYYLIRQPGISRAALHGLACGLAMGIRPTALILIALTLAFLGYEMLRNRKTFSRYMMATGAYLLTVIPTVILVWPFLWKAPLDRFLIAWEKFSAFPWSGELLFFGDYVPATELPWYYLPAWMGATLPILLCLLLAAGCLVTIFRVTSTLFRSFQLYTKPDHSLDLFCLLLLTGSVGAIVYKGSVLYDAWRQVYFVFPALVYLAVLGLHRWWTFCQAGKRVHLQRITQLAVGGTLTYLLTWCLLSHPHQHNYFNMLAGDELEKRFEGDYWGIGFYATAKELLDHDPSPHIRVSYSNYSGKINHTYLESTTNRQIERVAPDDPQCDYYITNFRFPGELAKYLRKEPPFDTPYFYVDHPFGRGKLYGVFKTNSKR